MQRATRDAPFEACNEHATWRRQHARHTMQHATSDVQRATHKMQRATYAVVSEFRLRVVAGFGHLG